MNVFELKAKPTDAPDADAPETKNSELEDRSIVDVTAIGLAAPHLIALQQSDEDTRPDGDAATTPLAVRDGRTGGFGYPIQLDGLASCWHGDPLFELAATGESVGPGFGMSRFVGVAESRTSDSLRFDVTGTYDVMGGQPTIHLDYVEPAHGRKAPTAEAVNGSALSLSGIVIEPAPRDGEHDSADAADIIQVRPVLAELTLDDSAAQ